MVMVESAPDVKNMFETFQQTRIGAFKRTFYNPFEIKHRKRTSKEQFKILEEAFQENNKPTASERRALAASIGMTPRAVQVWFQNRRAKNRTGGNSGSESQDSGDNFKLKSPSMSITITDTTNSTSSTRGVERNRPTSQVPLNNGPLGRRHSMPEMQQPNLLDLPFKELHNAIFGKTNNPPLEEDTVTPKEQLKVPKNPYNSEFVPIAPASHGSSQPRRGSACSPSGFMTPYMGMHPGMGIYHQNLMVDPMMAAMRQPMEKGQLARQVSAQSLHSADHHIPSLSAPQSSPPMGAHDQVSYFSHEDALHMQNPEAMAMRLSMSFAPNELDMFLSDIGHPNKGNQAMMADNMDAYYQHQASDLNHMLFTGGNNMSSSAHLMHPSHHHFEHHAGINPLELSGDPYLFQD